MYAQIVSQLREINTRVIAPAATGADETLALFDEHPAGSELPPLRDATRWPHLPPDPRRLRAVDDAQSA